VSECVYTHLRGDAYRLLRVLNCICTDEYFANYTYIDQYIYIYVYIYIYINIYIYIYMYIHIHH